MGIAAFDLYHPLPSAATLIILTRTAGRDNIVSVSGVALIGWAIWRTKKGSFAGVGEAEGAVEK
jgi:hypothetical protein